MINRNGEPVTLKRAYDILDLDSGASLDQVKQSYRRAARLYHPDLESALADPDKFHAVTSAYNMIRKARSFDTRQGTLKDKFKPGRKSSRRVNDTLTWDELTFCFDRSADNWSKIEAARALFEKSAMRFEKFAIKRLRRSSEKVTLELIPLLGALNTRQALDAIAPFLTTRNKNLCIAAFVALDRAGHRGQEILDHHLKTPSAARYRLSRIFADGDFEKRLVKDRLVPSDQMRRLSAAIKRTGIPLTDFLEGLGVTIPSSA